MVFTNPQSRTPSAGYQISAAAALLGTMFLFVALYGTWLQSIGGDPIDAMGWPGQVAFAGMFLLLFTLRLIFWSRSPPALQSALRTAFTVLFGLTVVLSAFTVVFALIVMGRGGPHAEPIFIGGFTTFAALCQIGTVNWLLRYRQE